MVTDRVMDASWAYEDEKICYVTCKKSIATGTIMDVHLQVWIRESQEGYKQSDLASQCNYRWDKKFQSLSAFFAWYACL